MKAEHIEYLMNNYIKMKQTFDLAMLDAEIESVSIRQEGIYANMYQKPKADDEHKIASVATND